MARRRPLPPPDQTSAEAFYYLKQMNNRTPMVVVLDNGEQLRGHIEWYDRNCIKVNREGEPNLMIFKHAIKYLYKQEEEAGDGPPEA
jgi:RNA chaperone Hfq